MQLITLATSGFIAGISKSALPGAAILMVPLMASAFAAKESVGLALPILVAADLIAAPYYRHEALSNRRILGILLAGALVGIGLGCIMMNRIDGELFKPLIGGVVLFMLALKFVVSHIKKDEPRGDLPSWARLIFGVSAGTATALANAAGPIISLHMISSNLEKRDFIACTLWFFLVANLLKVPFYWHIGIVSPVSLRLDLVAIPFVALGAQLGLKVVHRIDQKLFLRIITGLTLISALKLVSSII